MTTTVLARMTMVRVSAMGSADLRASCSILWVIYNKSQNKTRERERRKKQSDREREEEEEEKETKQ